uniref:Uncharacterized protein n=1 Tax=Ditylenchus dipsaci TaxID=166011 RepID=A0A915DIA1_9BILA
MNSTNKEKTLLYFFLSASSGVIILLLACIFYQCRARSKEKKQANLCASRNHQTISVCRLPQDKSGAELSSLIGSSSQSNHTSPLYLDSDDSRNCVRLDNGIVGPSNQSMADYCGVGNGNGSGNYIYGASPALQQQIYHSSGSSHSSAEKFSCIRTNSRGGTIRSARTDYQWGSMGDPTGKYTRYSQVTPPRIPPSLHYYN